MTAVLRSGPAAGRRMALAVASVEAALLAVLALIAGLLVWTLAAPESAVSVEAGTAAPVRAAPPSRAAADWSVLWTTDPFSARGEPQTAAVQAAPETTLNLSLFGVRAGAGGAPGTAYVRTPDNRQGAYREGQEIIPGVTLDRVYPDHVAISRNGVSETLYLEGARRERAASAAIAPARSGGPVVVSPEDFYSAARFQPVSRDGRAYGMRIDAVSNYDLLDRTGLREGDIVIEIGGRPLSAMGNLTDAFERMSRSGQIALTVERGGAQIPVSFTFETVRP